MTATSANSIGQTKVRTQNTSHLAIILSYCNPVVLFSHLVVLSQHNLLGP